MEWLGIAKTTFTHSTAPLVLQKNDGSSTDLATICKASTPPCRLNPLLFNGHLQTMWTAVKQEGPPVYYKRKLFQAENQTYHGSFAVDFVTRPFSESDDTLPPRTVYFSEDEFSGIASQDSRPMLVVLHGLSGGSYEIYLNSAQRRTNLQTRPVTHPSRSTSTSTPASLTYCKTISQVS
jgi:uncharacterized protein